MVIFSFYRPVLPMIERYLKKKGIGYVKVWGGMDAQQIFNLSVAFKTDPTIQVFLTTDAGEKGIDLQVAKYLVNVDIPMSWEKYDQRIGRIKRLHSTQTHCVVYNLVLKGSMEERQLRVLENKGELALAIEGKSTTDVIKPVPITLRDFLKAA